MKLKNLLPSVLCALMMCLSAFTYGQTTISGTVMDAELGDPLIGANVVIAGTTEGASTDIDGNFSITSSTPLPWTLEVTYTGFVTQNVTVDGPQSGMVISLASQAILGDEVIISASRRREKVQEAPASVSVLTARKLQASPNENPARSLVNLPGVTVQQQSAGRINIQLRGDGGLFGSATFPILDYRSLSGPGLGTFDNLNSALNNTDIERIEVVRGPGSALYGPDVTAGVIHFITKSPIDRPGTTIEVIGGELNTFGVSARHATKVSDKFGFKINAVYKKGDEFTLDPNDPDDAVVISSFFTSISDPVITNEVIDFTTRNAPLLTQNDLDPDDDGNMMQDFWEQNSVSATLEFRPTDDLSVNISGGTNFGSAVFYNDQGEGLSQSREVWTQGRFQKGGLFGQIFYLSNDGGSDDRPTFLYRTGWTTPLKREQLEGQLQYNFETPSFLNAIWTAGIDYRQSKADTRNTVYGRSENDDDFGVVGGYIQTKIPVSPKLDLVAAGRYDGFSFLDDGAFQPRAVLVYKASPTHTFRLGYNRAIGSPTQLQTNIDFPVSTVNVPGLGTQFGVWLKGNREAQGFGNDPQIQWAAFLQSLGYTGISASSTGIPNVMAYSGLHALVIGGGLQQGLLDAMLPASIVNNIIGFLINPANVPFPFTGETGVLQATRGLASAPQATLRTEDTWEFGYKGLINGKLGVSVDIYNKKIDGATLFTTISPTFGGGGFTLPTNFGSTIAGSGLRDFIFNQLGGAANPAAGPTADAVTANIVGAYTGGQATYEGLLGALGANGILGTVPTTLTPTSAFPLITAGYRTFEEFDYTGADVGLEYYVNDDLSIFGNYSFISDNMFTPTIKNSDGATDMTSIGVPLNKFRLGFTYAPEVGFRGNLAFQHDDSFEYISRLYGGTVPARNLVDAAFGYKWENGLSLDLTAQNLFDNEYRQYPNFPKIGRRVIAKLTYSFGENP